MCVWRKAGMASAGGTPSVSWEIWRRRGLAECHVQVGRTSPPSAFSPMPPLYSLVDQFWEELIMVCLFKQEEWPKILQCYGIFLYLFLPRHGGHCWNQDEFRQWGCSLLEASSILTVFSGLSLFLWLFSSLTEGFYPWLLGRHLRNPPNPLVLISKGLVNDRGFPAGVSGKNRPAKAGDARDTGLIPGSGRSPGEGKGNPLQYSCLPQNSMDRGAWLSAAHRVAKLSDTTERVLREWQLSLLLHWASMRTNKTSSDRLKPPLQWMGEIREVYHPKNVSSRSN